MEYSKEMLIKEAIRKVENMDDLTKDCLEIITAISNQRKVIRYLLYLGYEKTDKDK